MSETIPWAMSDIKPCGLTTLKDMTPEQADRSHQDALYWAKEGLATWRYDRCNRCGERYAVLSPNCANKKEHEEVAAKLAGEQL